MFFFSSRRRHTRSLCDWSSDVCSSDLVLNTFDLSAERVKGIHLADKSKVFNTARVEALEVENLIESALATMVSRSEERRVGKECRSRGLRYRGRRDTSCRQ